jgi:hypothetical protein
VQGTATIIGGDLTGPAETDPLLLLLPPDLRGKLLERFALLMTQSG